MARILSSQIDLGPSVAHSLAPVLAAEKPDLGAVESIETSSFDGRLAVENEIARLTWQVLDGQASLEVRQRLAELVSSQYRSRQTPR